MKKSELAQKAARKHSIEPGAAADSMDRLVNEIICALRRGKEAHLPGLGKLIPGKYWAFRQESDER
jgi:nucleoid DNA-binding protein